MRVLSKPALVACCSVLVLAGLAAHAQSAQNKTPVQRQYSNETYDHGDYEGRTDRTLNADDGLSVLAAALDPKVRRYSGGDCSHLVHAIYKRAGFPYAYTSSTDLYAGVEGFRRVMQPQPGDLIVWRGHMGIVVQPSKHVFYSFLRKGPTVSDYTSSYWIRRGNARFYRYVKNDPCPGCTHARQRDRRHFPAPSGFATSVPALTEARP